LDFFSQAKTDRVMCRKHALSLLVLPFAFSLESSADSKWDVLRSELENWAFTDGFAFEVGVSTDEPLFLYEHGNFTMQTKVQTASTSKWPIATFFTNLVNAGVFPNLDVKPSEYLPYWTTNKTDLRSKVTLRNFLSFTSGFGGGAPGLENNGRLGLRGLDARLADDPPCMYNLSSDFAACSKQIYEQVKLEGEPGKVFAYNSYHFQLAGAMAVAATKKDIQTLLKEYLFEPFQMKETDCMESVSNPILAVCLQTTGRDYSNFLSHLLTYAVIPKNLTEQMEKDYTPFLTGPTLFGMPHFLCCRRKKRTSFLSRGFNSLFCR
jgi:CubicO group peptidase (beta-lactamase class C family)